MRDDDVKKDIKEISSIDELKDKNLEMDSLIKDDNNLINEFIDTNEISDDEEKIRKKPDQLSSENLRNNLQTGLGESGTASSSGGSAGGGASASSAASAVGTVAVVAVVAA